MRGNGSGSSLPIAGFLNGITFEWFTTAYLGFKEKPKVVAIVAAL